MLNVRKNKVIKQALKVRTNYEVVEEELYCVSTDEEQKEVDAVIKGLREAGRIAAEANLVIEELVSMPHFDDKFFDMYFDGELTIDEACNVVENDLTTRSDNADAEEAKLFIKDE